MMSSGYPIGAEFDPRAPWNRIEPTMVKCKACNGNGYHWFAYHIDTGHETECTEGIWNSLLVDEDEAFSKGENCIRGEVEKCSVCDGEGEVEYDYEDFEPDYEDY